MHAGAVMINIVLPSGAARDAASVPITVPAPGRPASGKYTLTTHRWRQYVLEK